MKYGVSKIFCVSDNLDRSFSASAIVKLRQRRQIAADDTEQMMHCSFFFAFFSLQYMIQTS